MQDGSAAIRNELASLRKEVQMILQAVSKLTDEVGKLSKSESERSQQHHEQHPEKEENGCPSSPEPEEGLPSDGAGKIQNGHDQQLKQSETASSSIPELERPRLKQVEALQHRIERHNTEAETVASKPQSPGELPNDDMEGLGCDREPHINQARKECSAAPVTAKLSNTTVDATQTDLRLQQLTKESVITSSPGARDNAHATTSQIDHIPKQATSESSASSELRKRAVTGAGESHANTEQRTKKARIEGSARLDTNRDGNVIKGFKECSFTKDTLPAPTTQGRTHTQTPSQASTTRVSGVELARRMRSNIRPAQNQKQVTQKQASASAQSALKPGIRKRARDKSERWLVSEQQVLIKLMNGEKKNSKGPALPCGKIARAFNEKMKGVVQRRGEKSITGSVLRKHRVAPIRTAGSIANMMRRCQKEGKRMLKMDGDSAEQPLEIEDADTDEDDDDEDDETENNEDEDEGEDGEDEDE
ncbi:hypothetical protein ONS96_004190 [Cadophora gregata f. sp. sojae]|nr:hypothetical protein ONS96_004190 [Cadophora gregata f. sp. sojae]